jgi:hypothetical protein
MKSAAQARCNKILGLFILASLLGLLILTRCA